MTAVRKVRQAPVVVLGVAPADDGQAAWSHLSPSGQKLAALVGCDPKDLGRFYALDNLVPYPEPSRQALYEAGHLYKFRAEFWYLLAGTEVVRALGVRAKPAPPTSGLTWHTVVPGVLEWYESREDVTMAVLPHPSGRNRWYNDTRCRQAAVAFLTAHIWIGKERAHELYAGRGKRRKRV